MRVACNLEGCEEMIFRRDKDAHMQGCKHRIIQCDLCGKNQKSLSLMVVFLIFFSSRLGIFAATLREEIFAEFKIKKLRISNGI